MAGIGTMKYKRFITYNVSGALLWAVGIASLGYFLGEAADAYLLPMVVAIIVVSVLPPALHILRDYLKERQAKRGLATDSHSK
jgi:membrane-associated protein